MDRKQVVYDIVSLVKRELSALADPVKATSMARYMKTDPSTFYGVQKPSRVPIVAKLNSEFTIDSQKIYEAAVGALWELPHREEKYLALDLARMHKQFITPSAMTLYESMIRTGAWWDFVDDIASNLVGGVLLTNRKEILPIMNRWIKDEDMWIRRTALISQLRHKDKTDKEMLFRHCRICMDENEFFIRKAIGWSVREYSKTNPDDVLAFLEKEKANLSGLSYREGSKILRKQGRL